MNSDFLAITYGLSSALTWGAGDFSGGFATKRSNVFTVIFISQIIGAILLVLLGFVFSEAIPDLSYLLWGALAGLFGTLGLIALYTALAKSKMGLVAPLSAVVTAIIPVVFTFFSEGLPKVNQLIGFGIALLAVWFLSYSGKKTRVERKELGLSLLAGTGFGLFFICIDKASTEVIMWPLVSARMSSMVMLLMIIFSRGQIQSPGKKQIPFIILAGIFDAAGNSFFALAAHLGRLDVSSVLASLYPASTVLLAWLLLKERLQSQQWIGVIAAIGALILISV